MNTHFRHRIKDLLIQKADKGSFNSVINNLLENLGSLTALPL